MNWEEVFEAYLHYGGMPGITDVGLIQDHVLTLLDGIYSTIILHDVLERKREEGQRKITDYALLRKMILFLSDNIGSSTSLTSISNTLI